MEQAPVRTTVRLYFTLCQSYVPMGRQDDSLISYRYTFIMDAERSKTFELQLDPSTLALCPGIADTYADWNKLACWSYRYCCLTVM